MSNLSSAAKTPISSSNHKSVVLHQWWLIKVERESKLGVGGYVNRESLGSRGMRLLGSASIGKRLKVDRENQTEKQVFCSAEIVKRLDNNTLESIDGITITLIGCIHRSRTLSYGFPPEVCDHFFCGFPLNWEGYFGKSCDDECFDTTKSTLPLSFDDLPVTHVRDILMSLSTTQKSESCDFTSIIIKDILKQCNGVSFNQSDSHELHKKEDDISEKTIEETLEINSCLVEEDLETCSSWAGKTGDGISEKTIEETREINSFPVEEDLETCKETKGAGISSLVGKKEDGISGKTIEEIQEINSCPVEEDLETCKETEAAWISSRASTELKKCVSGKKRKVIQMRDRYPLRSMRLKKSNRSRDWLNSLCD